MWSRSDDEAGGASAQNRRIAATDVPVPALGVGRVLVRITCSVVSAGTGRQMMEFCQKSLLGKAWARPDLVRKVVAAAQTEGVAEAYQQAMGRLDTFRPLGYRSVGTVVNVGAGVSGIKVGDRLACSGSGFACHAEYVTVPQTLCALVPDGVSDEEAAFATLGAIALHALRLAELQLGERVVISAWGCSACWPCRLPEPGVVRYWERVWLQARRMWPANWVRTRRCPEERRPS
jgi:threonine dehydrogenase-like Zn-dependent dehydrogenase